MNAKLRSDIEQANLNLKALHAQNVAPTIQSKN